MLWSSHLPSWPGWLQFMIAAILQAVLLAMCITWKIRQNKLNIDDFGRPLAETPNSPSTIIVPFRHEPGEDVLVGQPSDTAVEQDTISTNEATPLLVESDHRHKRTEWWTRVTG